MRARDLAQPFPSVRTDTAALEAAKLLARHNLPGLIVLDERDRPSSILPGTQVLRLAVPTYCQEDPTLARVVDESHADVFWQELRILYEAFSSGKPSPLAELPSSAVAYSRRPQSSGTL